MTFLKVLQAAGITELTRNNHRKGTNQTQLVHEQFNEIIKPLKQIFAGFQEISKRNPILVCKMQITGIYCNLC